MGARRRAKQGESDPAGALAARHLKAIDVLANGGSHRSAAEAAGVVPQTLSEWMSWRPFGEALSEAKRRASEAAEEARLEAARLEGAAYGSAQRAVWTAFATAAEWVARDLKRRSEAARKNPKGSTPPKASELEAFASTLERLREIDVSAPMAAEELSDLPLAELSERILEQLRVLEGGKKSEPTEADTPKPETPPASMNGNGNGAHPTTE